MLVLGVRIPPFPSNFVYAYVLCCVFDFVTHYGVNDSFTKSRATPINHTYLCGSGYGCDQEPPTPPLLDPCSPVRITMYLGLVRPFNGEHQPHEDSISLPLLIL